ncbi:MAG: amidohydrolase [Solirubrobacteraceae bacterium]
MPVATGHADLLVVGRLVTMDAAHPEVEALAARAGRIVGLGTVGELEGLRGPRTEVVQLGDQVAYPGFVEPHMHLWTTGLFEKWIDCSPLRHPSFDAILGELRAASAHPGDEGWVLGQLYDPSLLDGEPELTRELLDQVIPDHPALVMNASMHFGYANSRALALAGITEDTPDPPGGTYGRTDGRLNGSIGEVGAILTMLAVVPKASHDEFLECVLTIMRTAAGRGVTKIHEAGTGGLFGVAELDMLHSLAADGRLPVRVTTAQFETARPAFESAGLQPDAGDDLVRAVSWKVIADGSNQGRSGYQSAPYLGRTERGRPNYSSEEVAEIIGRADREGWQLMVHANGDAAIEEVVGAYEAALVSGRRSDRRHRIEHCSLATEDQLARMAAIGVSPSFLINHVYFWGRAFRDTLIGPERAARLDPVASARRHGLRPSFHSDYNVTPIDPLRAVQTAVTRRVRDGGEVLNAAECDSVETAMRAITIDAAWQTHTDDQVGSLKVGKFADLVFLSEDPQRVDPEAIADIAVLQTRLAGAPPPGAGGASA